MTMWKNFRLLSVFCFLNAEARSTYKECIVYEPGEIVKSKCTFCIPSYESSYTGQWTNRTYCREFVCQGASSKDCTDEISVKDSCCQSCPGTCAYGGRGYSVGDIFKCLDGINRCKCTDTGEITQVTKKAYSKDTLCEPRHYGACTLYEEYEQKPSRGSYIRQDNCAKETFNDRQMDICRNYGCYLPIECSGWKFNGCYYCPGTCNYGGRSFAANSTFTCIDGVNTCTCSNDGVVTHISSIKPTINALCKQYGKCKIYFKNEEKGKVCSGCRRYPMVPYAEICLEYTCATNNCSSPSTDNGCCSSCPGTCNYAGRVYKSGEDFTCLNGYDACSCEDTGIVTLRHRRSQYFPFNKVCFSD